MSLNELLKNPQYIRSTPLDAFFQKLNDNILVNVDSLNQNNHEFVLFLLQYLQELNVLTLDEENKLQAQQSDMLPISLHDMKYLEKFIALIVTYGIYANLPAGFQVSTHNLRDESPLSGKPNLTTLELVTAMVHSILLQKGKISDYVRSVLLKGPLFTSTYLGLLALCIEKPHTKYETMLQDVESTQQSYELFQMYTLFVHELKNVAAKERLLTELGTLAVRRDNGVLSLIDFILAVREDEQVDVEKMNRVSQVLVAKPKCMSSSQYFSKLFPQIYDGLSMVNRPVVVSCLNNVVTTFFLKNPRITRDFLFEGIYEVLFNEPRKEHSAKELNDMINVLLSLSKNSCNRLLQALVEGVDKRLFYLNLWIYAFFLKRNQKINPLGQENGPYYEVILTLLKSFLVLLQDHKALDYLSMNMLNYRHDEWEYRIDFETQLAYITLQDNISDLRQQKENKEPLKIANELFASIDEAIDLFVQLLKMINREEMVKEVFLAVLDRWVKMEKPKDTVLGVVQANALALLDLKTLEKLNNEFSTDIVRQPEDILRVLEELIDFSANEAPGNDSDDEDSDDESRSQPEAQSRQPNAMEIILQILQTVLSISPAQLASSKSLLRSIDDKLMNQGDDSLHKAINKVLQSTEAAASEKDTDQKALNEATLNVRDSSAPIQVLGLTQLIKLVQNKSEVITAKAVTQWHMQFLKSQDPYVYLTAIRGLAILCQYDKFTLDKLLSLYTSEKSKNNRLDDVLKVGEVFIHYIQRENELFQGIEAHKVIDACLANIRRRSECDNRIRMSALSILGMAAQTNARGIQDRIEDMLDCSFGILQMEIEIKDAFVVRRAALHLIHDLLYSAGTSLFPLQYSREKLCTLLEYTREKDEDPLVCDQAAKLLYILQ